jgi:hypothetical protein
MNDENQVGIVRLSIGGPQWNCFLFVFFNSSIVHRLVYHTFFTDRQLTGFRDWAQYTTRSNGRKLLFVYLFTMFWRNKNKKRVCFYFVSFSQNSTDDTCTQYQMIHSLTHETGSGADRLLKKKNPWKVDRRRTKTQHDGTGERSRLVWA